MVYVEPVPAEKKLVSYSGFESHVLSRFRRTWRAMSTMGGLDKAALAALSVCSCAPQPTAPQQGDALAQAARECAAGRSVACKMVTAATNDNAAGMAPLPTAPSPEPNTYQPPPWWSGLSNSPEEVFIGVTTDDKTAYWATNKYISTAAGTRVVFLHDESRTPSGPVSELSAKLTFEFNCKSRQYHILRSQSFSDRGLTGSELGTAETPADPWSYVPPYSIADTIFTKVCVPDIAQPPPSKRKKKQPAGNRPTVI
jgi:hypothetical protein